MPPNNPNNPNSSNPSSYSLLPPPDSLITPSQSLSYWSATPPTLSGILGGYPQISRIDLQGSRSFLTKLRHHDPRTGRFTAGGPRGKGKKSYERGVDCGAGIGRVTEGLLRGVCEVVDCVEPVEGFGEVLRGLRDSEGGDVGGSGRGRIGEVYVVGLQDWNPNYPSSSSSPTTPSPTTTTNHPTHQKYDLIFTQWCLGHLTDLQLTTHLRHCATALTPHTGWLVIKENMSTDPQGQDIYDDVDSSVTRTDDKLRKLFDEAGWRVVRTELQAGFPKGLGLFPVRMYGLRPRGWEGEGEGG